MPEAIRYIVTQTRDVEVVANNAKAAVLIASAAFEHGQNSDSGVAKDKAPEGVWGNTMSRIKETSLLCERKKY